MSFIQLYRSIFTAVALGFFTTNVSSEELSVTTFVPPQHHTNTLMFKWFGEELEKRSGGSLTMKLIDDFKDVKVLAVATVAGSLFVTSRDVSTMDSLKGAKLVPLAAMTKPHVELTTPKRPTTRLAISC